MKMMWISVSLKYGQAPVIALLLFAVSCRQEGAQNEVKANVSSKKSAQVKSTTSTNWTAVTSCPQRGTNWIIPDLGMEFLPVLFPNSSDEVLFSKYETRVKDFEAFVRETGYDCTNDMITLGIDPYKNRKAGDSWKHPGFPQGPDYPVVGVNWYDAVQFCKWLTKRERKAGRLLESQIYCLPTDREWSRAVGLPLEFGATPEQRHLNALCGGRDFPDSPADNYSRLMKNSYPWGNRKNGKFPQSVANYAGEESGLEKLSCMIIAGYNDEYQRMAPVGSFKPNEYGLFDMGGNVWEWCADCYWWYANKAFHTDGKRVARGASWHSGIFSLYSAFRISRDPLERTNEIGFRVIVTPEGGRGIFSLDLVSDTEFQRIMETKGAKGKQPS